MRPFRTGKETIAFCFVLVCLGAALLVFLKSSQSTASDDHDPICLDGGLCLVSMVIPSAFDALPKELQNAVFSRYSVQSGSRYSFSKDDNGQLVAKIGSKRFGDQSLAFEMLHIETEKDSVSFAPLSTDLLSARYAESPKPAACDLGKPGRIAGFSERVLRRCLRAAYLLQSVPEFNERTQKLFNEAMVRYENGTTGRLTLNRDGLTDADRKMVLREVAKIDSKARSLGGFR